MSEDANDKYLMERCSTRFFLVERLAAPPEGKRFIIAEKYWTLDGPEERLSNRRFDLETEAEDALALLRSGVLA